MKKNERLLETLGEVDDEHIPQDNEKKKKSGIMKWLPLGAGLTAAAVILAFALNTLRGVGPIDTLPEETTGTSSAPVVTSDTSVTSVTTSVTSDSVPEITEPVEISYERVRKNTVVSEITANSVLDGGAAVNTDFTVKTSVDLTVGELTDKLVMSPAADFTVEKTDDCLYTLKTSVDFGKGSVVKLAALSEEGGTGDCWAFQIVDDFRVKSVYPADGAQHVSDDSGIELEFSEPVDVSTAAAHFSVTPELKGRFETHGDMLYFIPEEKMKDSTMYTVAVSEGLRALSGNVLEEGCEFSFFVHYYEEGFFTMTGACETFIPGDPIVIELHSVMTLADEPVSTVLYKYGSADDYMNDVSLYVSENRFEQSNSKMTEIFSSEEIPLAGKGMYNPRFVMLPYDLEEGYYAASITRKDRTIYYFLEVNPVSVYSLSIGDKTVFYVNDAETGKPAVGADIILHTKPGDFTAKTNSSGVADIYTGDNCTRSDMLEIVYDGHRYIDSLMNYSTYKAGYDDLYYTYIYTDREAYQTTDTVNVWGAVIPRRKGVSIPENLLFSFGTEEADGVTEKLDISADGTFTASYSFVDRASGWWSGRIAILDGDNDNAVIRTKRVQIMDYVKPDYTFDIELPEYVIMPHKNPHDVTIHATYFDGTPAAGLLFEKNNPYDKIVSGSLTTDEKGMSQLTMLTNDADRWEPYGHGEGFSLTGVENRYLYFGGSFTAFHRDVMLEKSYDREAETYTVRTNRIDFDKIPEYMDSRKRYRVYDGEGDHYYSYEYAGNGDYGILRGEAYDTEVSVQITRTWSEKTESGTYYDFIEKKTVTEYTYTNHSENLGTFRVNTVNGVGVFDSLPITDDKSSYHLTITYKDSLGQKVEMNDYISSLVYTRYTDYREFMFTPYTCTFEEDQAIEFSLYEMYAEERSGQEGSVFFVAYQNDIIDAKVYDSTTFSYVADDRGVPDFRYSGAYFDGRHVFPIESGMAKFAPAKRNIELEISTDKEKYDAGETVTLTVYAKDINGRPVGGAPVSLSVVDEAAFSVAPQYVNTLEDMYYYVRYASGYQKCSYVQHLINGEFGHEKGGGGDDGGVRKDFRDNPYFGEEKTDANGKAVFRFTLADSITTWRATVQAVSKINDRLYAGSAKHPIVATRPVFITPVMLSKYVQGDDISVTAKGAGIGKDDKISVTLEGNGQNKTIDIKPCATANFGSLPAGEYTVTFRADNGESSDAVQLPLSVVETKQEVRIGKDLDLEELYKISPTKWPVSVTFFDKEYLFCKSILQGLCFYSGKRFDMQIASEFAENELGWYDSDYSARVLSATSTGFANLMPNGGESVRLTALLCAAFPEYVSQDAVEKAFTEKLRACNANDMSYYYMGLAALGRPVLDDIKRAFDEYDSKLSFEDKLCLTAGLALGGDFSAAYEKYISLTGDMKFYSNGGRPYAYLTDERKTSLALVTASVMDLPEADALARGLCMNEPQYDVFPLELVVYIRNYVPKIEGNAAFSYNLNGKREKVTLERYGMYTVCFDKERFLNADFSVDSGDVLVYASYTGRTDEKASEPEIKVTKKYSKESCLVGDTIVVTITAEPHCIIEDVIPSCARLVEKGELWRVTELGDQRVRLYTAESAVVTYKIRMTASGSFVTEGAYACGSGWGISKTGTITVKEENEEA